MVCHDPLERADSLFFPPENWILTAPCVSAAARWYPRIMEEGGGFTVLDLDGLYVVWREDKHKKHAVRVQTETFFLRVYQDEKKRGEKGLCVMPLIIHHLHK